jgi:uncharacterized protein YbjT (DUF2867 family)
VRIVVLGATGQCGRLVTRHLEDAGHDVLAAGRRTGVDAVTGAGLDAAFNEADVVVDLLGVSSLTRRGNVDFFRATTTNVVRAIADAKVPHLVTLSIWNCTHPQARRYAHYAGKAMQAAIVEGSGVPATIIDSTQWFELPLQVVQQTSFGPVSLAPHMWSRPAALTAVAERIAEIATAPPVRGHLPIAGPDEMDLFTVARAIAVEQGRRFVLPLRMPGSASFRSGVLAPPSSVPGTGPSFETWMAEHIGSW